MNRRLAAIILLLMATLPMVVYADTSLSDLAGNNSAYTEDYDDEYYDEEANKASGSSSAKDRTNEMLKGLSETSDVSLEDPTVQKVASPLKKGVTIVVQILCYVITIGLILRTTLDLTYITLPFTRGLLGGASMMAQSGQMGGMGGMDSMGGMDPYGGGMGGQMGGYGGQMGGYGGYGAPRRRSSGNRRGGTAGGFSWVSESAVRAVASGGTPLVVYAKDMSIYLVCTPILLVLTITGTLADFGFVLGSGVSTIIENLGAFFVGA